MGQSNPEENFERALDLVQKRYSWPDSYILNEPGQEEPYLTYERWCSILETISKAEAEDWKDRQRIAAFIGWQFYQFQPKSADSPQLPLDHYLNDLGLGRQPTRTPEEDVQAAVDMMANVFGVKVEA